MSYLSFSLKYRPRRFDDVVGQDHVAKTLKNALSQNRLAHAYLFTGPRGTGKTSTARILAAALNCAEGPTPEPCGVCDMCRSIALGNAMDVVEIDAASNTGVENIRDLRERVKFAPAEGRYKVYVLDEAHMLSQGAVNALLKTLEEPPPHVVFLLLTTESHKIIPTILSRCQHFEFRAITLADIAASLRRIAEQEQIQVDDSALMAIAQAAEGAMRDAQSIFDQVVAYADGPITIELVNEVLGVTDHALLSSITDQIISGDIVGCFASIDQAVSEGKDLVRLVEHLTIYLRDLLRLQVVGNSARGLGTVAKPTEAMVEQAKSLGASRLMHAIRTLAELQSDLKHSSQHALLVELTLAQLAAPPKPKQAEQAVPSTPVAGQTARRELAPAQPAAQPTAPASPGRPEPSRPEPMQQEPSSTPAPPPAQPVVASEAQLDLPTLLKHWPMMYDELRRMGHTPIGAILRDATPIAMSGDIFTIGFTARFHLNRIEGEYKKVVEQAAERLFARALRVNCKLFADADELRAAAQTAHTESQSSATQPDDEPDSLPAPQGPAQQGTETVPQPSDVTNDPVADEPGALTDVREPLTADQVVEQTLSLFDGSAEMTEAENQEQN